jgi:uncharacterized protein (DUF1015 family)
MARIKAFRALRPKPLLAEKVAALPYDVMSSEEARAMVKGDPYSFLHVDKAEIDLPVETGIHDPIVYETACATLHNMVAEGTLIKDPADRLYIYREVMSGRVQTGLVACAAIDDYLTGVIRKHENTRADKELDRINHVDRCSAQTGPIFLTYRSSPGINSMIEKWISDHKPVYDFISSDGITHTVWVIHETVAIKALVDAIGSIGNLYIADGHHRCASAVKVGLMRREASSAWTGKEEFNYFLSVLVPDSQIHIMSYNRAVRDLNGLTIDNFLDKVGEKFKIEPIKTGVPYKPVRKHHFGMFLDNKWYCLTPKPGSFDKGNPVSRLDVSILQNNLLAPVLGIADPRTDKRIDFIGGGRGLAELERRVGSDMKVAFSLFPTSVSELIEIADSGGIMPPKSTWFEPKLRSGLFIHEI